MKIFFPVRAVPITDWNHARDVQRVAEELHRLGNSLTDADAVGHRADDLMGIRLFQLIITHVVQNKVMDILLAFRFFQIPRGTKHTLHPCLQCLLLIPNLRFLKHIVRQKVPGFRSDTAAAGKTDCIKNLRVIQPKLKEQGTELLSIQFWNSDRRREFRQTGQNRVISFALDRLHETEIIRLSAQVALPSLARPGLS